MATLFAQSGVIRTDTLAEAFDVAQLLAHQPVPRGDRVAIVGNSTALGVLALDACLDAGLTVADDARSTSASTASPEDWPRRSPGGRQGRRRRGGGGLRAAGRDRRARTRRGAAGAAAGSDPGGHHVPGRRRALGITRGARRGRRARRAGSVPSFRTPERAVAALAHAVRYGRLAGRARRARSRSSTGRRRRRGQIPGRRLAGRTGPRAGTDRRRTGQLLGCYGIAVAEFEVGGGRSEAVAAAERSATRWCSRRSIRRCGTGSTRPASGWSARRPQVAWTPIDDLAARAGMGLRAGHGPAATAGRCRRCSASPPTSRSARWSRSGSAGWPPNCSTTSPSRRSADRRRRRRPDRRAEGRAAAGRLPGAAVVDRAALLDLALRLSALADDLPEIGRAAPAAGAGRPGGICVTGATGRIGPPPPAPTSAAASAKRKCHHG